MSRIMVLVGSLLSGRTTETGVNMAILMIQMRERILVHRSMSVVYAGLAEHSVLLCLVAKFCLYVRVPRSPPGMPLPD